MVADWGAERRDDRDRRIDASLNSMGYIKTENGDDEEACSCGSMKRVSHNE